MENNGSFSRKLMQNQPELTFAQVKIENSTFEQLKCAYLIKRTAYCHIVLAG